MCMSRKAKRQRKNKFFFRPVIWVEPAAKVIKRHALFSLEDLTEVSLLHALVTKKSVNCLRGSSLDREKGFFIRRGGKKAKRQSYHLHWRDRQTRAQREGEREKEEEAGEGKASPEDWRRTPCAEEGS